MVSFIFSKKAKVMFLRLPEDVQQRITDKLGLLKKHEDIFSLLKGVKDLEPATHRLRIGSHRLLLALSGQKGSDDVDFLVLKVGHRKDVYR